MAKVKLTKGELKRQRDDLSRFQHYLPTLQLKKQQLQMKIFDARRRLQDKKEEVDHAREDIRQWAGVLADPEIRREGEEDQGTADIKKLVLPEDVDLGEENIAGVFVPVLRELTFPPQDYDLYDTPFWVDRAVERLRCLTRLIIETLLIEEEMRRLNQELRTTTQRVNLFEKVKIPEAQENIRKIQIYLGDQQANMVGISKVAKKKIEETMIS
ncbi:MAG: V-type ATP synthase subunit D [Candidatus Omnitrophota bacterium]